MSLLNIAFIAHDTSVRGGGRELSAALAQAHYLELREDLKARDLVSVFASDPSLMESWFAYSESKRTLGGWFLGRDGEIGRTCLPEYGRYHETLAEAVADYVLLELDYWAWSPGPSSNDSAEFPAG